MDIVLINPGDRKQVFQDLGANIAAIEPPFWLAVIASYLRNQDFQVAVIDANAENISPTETANRVKEINPLLSVVVVYGSQPSASTQNMTISSKICTALAEKTESKIALCGLHPSALPEQTMKEGHVDFVIDGEGPITLEQLLQTLKSNNSDYHKIPGLWFKGGNSICHSSRAPVIKDLDYCLPIGAWDLLPMEKYRAHNWHCFDNIENRQPYGAIYTSLGCPFNCIFCCINAPFGKPGIRYRSPKMVVDEIELLNSEYGIKNIKFVDELFVLKERHYMDIVNLIIDRDLDLNIWAYARVDTVKKENLKRMKQAGINWLALGIESANPDVRDGAVKRMRVKDIKEIVRIIQENGIYVIGNYIFGLPDDTNETMQETLDLALELNCEFANFYCAMAYPGSRLYEIAIEKKWSLPEEWCGFSQHAYNIQPLPTKHVTPKEVVFFRDNAFHTYYTNPEYLNMLTQKFGTEVKNHIEQVTKTRLKRKILES